MKKPKDYSLIARGEFTMPCSLIRTRVNVGSVDGTATAEGVTAMWDTGATQCGISQRLAERLGLRAVGVQAVRYGNGSMGREPVYPVRVTFQPSGRVAVVHANGFTDTAQDFIVGMNIISLGDMELKHEGGKLLFSYGISE